MIVIAHSGFIADRVHLRYFLTIEMLGESLISCHFTKYYSNE